MISPITFIDLPSLNWPFLPFHMEDFLQNATSQTCLNKWKWQGKFPFVFLPGNNDIYIHILCPLERMESPLISYSYQGEDLIIFLRGLHMQNHVQVIVWCKNTMEICSSFWHILSGLLKGILEKTLCKTYFICQDSKDDWKFWLFNHMLQNIITYI